MLSSGDFVTDRTANMTFLEIYIDYSILVTHGVIIEYGSFPFSEEASAQSSATLLIAPP